MDAASGVYFHGVRIPAPNSYLAQFTGRGGTWYSVVPRGNALSASGTKLVQTIRNDPAPFPVLVGGLPAGLADSTAVINHYLPLALFLVAGATFLLLLVLFRSVFISVKALVLNALSLGAMFGAMVWIFQDGHLSGLLGFHADRRAGRHHAHPHVLRGVRALHGLRGLPRLAHEGAARRRRHQ